MNYSMEQQIEYESNIITLLLGDTEDKQFVLATLSSSFFVSESLKCIFNAIQCVNIDNNPINVDTVKAKLERMFKSKCKKLIPILKILDKQTPKFPLTESVNWLQEAYLQNFFDSTVNAEPEQELTLEEEANQYIDFYRENHKTQLTDFLKAIDTLFSIVSDLERIYKDVIQNEIQKGDNNDING